MPAATPCSTCDTMWELINTGERDLQEIATVLGKPAPTLVGHLQTHKDDSLPLRQLITHQGKPLATPAGNPTVPIPQPPPPAATVPDEHSIGVASKVAAVFAAAALEDHPEPQHDPADVDTVLDALIADPDQRISDTAAHLLTLITDRRQRENDYKVLAALISERDQLNDRIDELTARLEPDAAMTSSPPELTPAQLRDWAAANQIDCPDKGPIPEAVRQAHRKATTP